MIKKDELFKQTKDFLNKDQCVLNIDFITIDLKEELIIGHGYFNDIEMEKVGTFDSFVKWLNEKSK